MSVALKISVRENCDSLYLYDRTGKYDPKCNPGGWCAPNEDVSEATAAEWHIYPPGSSDPIIIDCYPSFPNKDNTGLEVLPEDIGAEKFISGMWRFDYHVRINGVLHSVSCQKLLKEDVLCCLRASKIEADTSNFESKEVKESNQHFLLLDSAKANAKFGKTKEAQKIIDFLYLRCKCKC